MARRAVVYWDSVVFLALINQDKTPEQLQKANDVWVAAEKGLVHIVTSALTSAEVLYVKGAVKLDPSKRVLVSNFFRQDFISQKPLTREIAELARDVVWDTPIKPKDAVHVATAAYFKIREIHTFDNPLVDLKTVDVAGFLVSLNEPHFHAQLEMNVDPAGKGDPAV